MMPLQAGYLSARACPPWRDARCSSFSEHPFIWTCTRPLLHVDAHGPRRERVETSHISQHACLLICIASTPTDYYQPRCKVTPRHYVFAVGRNLGMDNAIRIGPLMPPTDTLTQRAQSEFAANILLETLQMKWHMPQSRKATCLPAYTRPHLAARQQETIFSDRLQEVAFLFHVI